MAPRPFRIFISSPSDVRPERLIAQRVVARLAREFAYHFLLEAVMWEREPLVATEHFQTMITRPSASDAVVVVLWSRLGTPLPQDQFPGPMSAGAVTGTEWEFEEAVKSYRANRTPSLFLYRKRAAISGTLDDEAGLQQQLRQKKLVEAFIVKWFGSTDGPVTAALHDFERIDEFEEKLEVHLRELIRSRISVGEREQGQLIRWHQGSPWRGLAAFEPEHAQVFFGRNHARADLRALLTRRAATGPAFILVTAASGTGKSSLVKAGLIPDISLPGMIPNVGLVRVAIMRPNDAEDRPLAALAGALLKEGALPELEAIGYDAARIERLLAEMPQEIATSINVALRSAAKTAQLLPNVDAKLLLVVDQFEEIYINAKLTREARNAFVDALEALANSGSVWVLATLRSDVYQMLDETPKVAQLLLGKDGQEGLFRLAPPTDTELAEIVRRPAEEAGLRFDMREHDGARLEDILIHAAARQSNTLPLLSFTLDELWRARTEHGKLTFSAYQELGGLEGAVAHRAEETLASLDPEVRTAFPRVLRSLVAIGEDEDAPITAQPAPLSLFAPGTAARKLVDAFIAARLFVVAGIENEPMVRLAHEALISHWQQAREQLSADRRDLETRALVERQQARWKTASGRSKANLLLRDFDLASAVDLARRWGDQLDRETHAFIGASQRRARSQQRLLVGAAVTFAIVAVIASLMGILAVRAQHRAQGNYDVAKEAVDSLIFDIAHGLRGMEGMRVETIAMVLNTVQRNIDRLALANPDDPALQRSRDVMFNNFVETYLAAGDLHRAHQAAVESLSIARTLASRSPDDAARKSDLSISYERFGDVLRAEGDQKGALEAYQSSMHIREQLVGANPENTDWQRDLSISYENIGDALSARGDYANALKAYRSDVRIVETLAKQNPQNTIWQRDLAVAHGRLGGALSASGKRDDALAEARTALSITEQLAKKDQSNALWQRDLSVGHSKVAELLSAKGDEAGALAEYQSGLDIATRLAQQDPGNAIWQRDVFVGLSQVGTRLPQAQAAPILGRALAVARAMAKAHPGNPQAKKDLAWIMARCRVSNCTPPG